MIKIISKNFSDGAFFGVTFEPAVRDGVFVGLAEVSLDADLSEFEARADAFEIHKPEVKPSSKKQRAAAEG